MASGRPTVNSPDPFYDEKKYYVTITTYAFASIIAKRSDQIRCHFYASLKQPFIRPIKTNLQRFLGRAEAERSEVSTEQSWLQSGIHL
ncbi:hypothetical protein DP643_27095 [Salmonella enterica]|nr:hypothetical protein [Salmonella enterica]EBM0568011.1 hypothetical protein [Salmonella enterica]